MPPVRSLFKKEEKLLKTVEILPRDNLKLQVVVTQ